MRIDSIIWPEERIEHIVRHAVTPEEVEGPMKQSKLPRTDSIQELAEFWDTHDLTGFDEELEEVAEPPSCPYCVTSSRFQARGRHSSWQSDPR